MADAAPLRAFVKGAFEVTGRGTVISVEILEGKVAAGDRVLVATAAGGTQLVNVRDIGFVEHAIGRPDFHAYLVLRIDTLQAEDVEIGGEVRSAATSEPETDGT